MSKTKWVKIGAGWQNESWISYQLEIDKAAAASNGKSKIYFSIFKVKEKKSDKAPDFDICTKIEVADNEEHQEQIRQGFQPDDKLDGMGKPDKSSTLPF
jgi:hypothetical protein